MIHSNSISMTLTLTDYPSEVKAGKSTLTTVSAAHNWFNRSDPTKPGVTYFQLTIWGKSGLNFLNYCSKGSHVLVHGSLKIEEYKKNDGSIGYSNKINVNAFQNLSPKLNMENSESKDQSKEAIQDDDLPF